LKGTSAGHFKDALVGFLGANVKSLSPNTISRANKPGKVNADQWAYIRNINPVECVFASVRLRTARTKNCGSPVTTLAMAIKFTHTVQKRCHRLRGYQLLADVAAGVQFKDGIRVE
jgi:hypothetical protein